MEVKKEQINRYLILTGGTLTTEFVKYFLKNNSVSKIVCIDGALKIAHEANIAIDYLVGDFDTADTSLVSFYKEQIEQGNKQIVLKQYNPGHPRGIHHVRGRTRRSRSFQAADGRCSYRYREYRP